MAKTTILMSTYNGEMYLEEQIISILNQTEKDIFILVRDDGSSDKTIRILNKYKGEKLDWYNGENVGPANSFMDLVYKAPESDYYSFSDQDDFWYRNKIEKAISKLKVNKPMLYYCRKRITDERLMPLCDGIDMYEEELSLGFSLMKCTVAGCTMVFNHELRKKLLLYKPRNIVMHDVWVLLVALALGEVIGDNQVLIDYRQHRNNFYGGETDKIKIFIDRLKHIVNHSNNHERSQMALEILTGYSELIKNEDKKYLELITNLNFKNKINIIFSNYFNRKSFIDTLMIKILIFLGWI